MNIDQARQNVISRIQTLEIAEPRKEALTQRAELLDAAGLAGLNKSLNDLGGSPSLSQSARLHGDVKAFTGNIASINAGKFMNAMNADINTLQEQRADLVDMVGKNFLA